MCGFNVVISIVYAVTLLCIGYSLLWGSDKRLLRSRDYCYKDLKIPKLSDEDFYHCDTFANSPIPKEYVIAKRHELSDYYLDYPPECLHPDMIWDDIPICISPWERNIDELCDYLLFVYGIKHEVFFKEKKVADVICELYELESKKLLSDIQSIPESWSTEIGCIRKSLILKSKIKEYFRKTTAADIVMSQYKHMKVTHHSITLGQEHH